MFHTGYDVKRETLEFQCISRGREEYLRVMDELILPMLKTSAVMVARDQAQMKNVYELYENSRHNGITDVEILTKPHLLEVVPWVRTNVSGGLRNYGEDVIDPWSTALAYATQAIANGAVIKRNCEVLDGSLSDGYWYLETNQGQFRAETVINSAGLFGDLVKRIRGDSDFTIKPRKGQFVVFDKTASSIVDTILLPVPDERTKGILRAPTIFGNVIVGPTADEQESRKDTSVDSDAIQKLVDFAHETVPTLNHHSITATYAGIRPATESKDFRIKFRLDEQWITVGGTRSTELTAALGIAKYVAGLYSSEFANFQNNCKSAVVTVPNLAEHRLRPYQIGGNGEIVCHCERVTRVEIMNALEGYSASNRHCGTHAQDTLYDGTLPGLLPFVEVVAAYGWQNLLACGQIQRSETCMTMT